MLRIYICPKCYNYRMVSRKPDAICLHCGATLDKCEVDYTEFVNMTDSDRMKYKENYKKRMMLYNSKLRPVHNIDNKRTVL